MQPTFPSTATSPAAAAAPEPPHNQPARLLSLEGVRRVYGDPPNQVIALDRVDFHVSPGEMVALMGPSGSGKSTLLTIAGGLEAPSEGSVRFAAHHLDKLPAKDLAEVRRRHIGFVFQSFNLLDGLTAAENVAAPLELDGVGARTARDEAQHLLDSVGLGDRCDAFPDDLSGGERQRVAIARGLVGDRRLLLADEPTGALDSQTGQQVLELLRQACSGNRSVVIVTHDPNIAAWAHRVVTLRDGQVASSYRPGPRPAGVTTGNPPSTDSAATDPTAADLMSTTREGVQ